MPWLQVTPFLLKRVTELTGGASLAANIALIKHNAAVGAAIAVELAKMAAQAHLVPLLSTAAGYGESAQQQRAMDLVKMGLQAYPAPLSSTAAGNGQ